MRAYLAILKDSFREAIASRVLLIALSGIVVVLVLLAPFSLKYEQATELRRSEITNPERLLTELQNGAQEKATPTSHLWSLLTTEQRDRVARLLNPDPSQPVSDRRGPRGNPQEREIVNSLNALIKLDGLYNAASWADARLPDEAVELQARASLTEPERRRLNLLLIAAAFPRSIQITDSQAISILYGTASILDSLPLTPSQFEPIFQRVLVAVITIFLGFFGIFASLLVTAGMIPRTFEPGEISLLLSKPVNRPLLFLTKFLGGCTFTLLYASVLVTGMWLLLGIRMNFWRSELLWCIPVYVFLFMIYFSISAVAGAIWRNSIVALSFVVIFWVGITVIGTAKQGIEDNIVRSRGIKEIVVGNGHVLSVDGKQNTWVWDSAAERWNEVFQVPAGQGMGRFAQRFLASSVRFAPIFDSAGGRILALQQNQTRFGSLGPPELVAGFADDGWERVSLGRLPDSATTILITSDGRVIVPTFTSLCESTEVVEGGSGLSNLLSDLTGGLIGGQSKAFRQLQPQDYPVFGNNFACNLNPADDSLLFYDGGVLTLMTALEDGKYSIVATRDLEIDSSGVLAVSGKHAILGLADGQILLLDAKTLKTVRQTKLPEGVLPRVCSAAKDGSTLAVLTHEKTILLFAGADAEPLTWKPAENGRCSAVAFSEEGRLLVSDGRLAVREYDLTTKQPSNVWAESPSFIYSLYDMVIDPLWTLLPKPSVLDQFVPYVMTGDATVLINEAQGPPGMIDRESLQQERSVFNARQAIFDNGLFVVIVLGIGCLIISRRDF